jgi:hypothetical protein
MQNIFNFAATRSQHYGRFVLQTYLLAKHFPFLKCSLRRGKLECVGSITPTEHSETYKIRLRYTEWGFPSVKILHPHIEARPEIHMYRDGTLCLFHPPSQPWTGVDHLHSTIIPWTAEWLVYYELFLIEGRWLGPEVAH